MFVSDEKYTKCSKLLYHKYSEKKIQYNLFFLLSSPLHPRRCRHRPPPDNRSLAHSYSHLFAHFSSSISFHSSLSPYRALVQMILSFHSNLPYISLFHAHVLIFIYRFSNSYEYIILFESYISTVSVCVCVCMTFVHFMETLTIRQNWIDTSILFYYYREHKSCIYCRIS